MLVWVRGNALGRFDGLLYPGGVIVHSRGEMCILSIECVELWTVSRVGMDVEVLAENLLRL